MTWAFPSSGDRGATLSCGAPAGHCGGFSYEAGALGCAGISSCGT